MVGAGVMCELKICVPEFAAGDCACLLKRNAGVCFVEANEGKWLTENRRNWFPFKPALTRGSWIAIPPCRAVVFSEFANSIRRFRSASYVSERENSTWRKVLNAELQRIGGDELFERERHNELWKRRARQTVRETA